jgi:hypothetical protein
MKIWWVLILSVLVIKLSDVYTDGVDVDTEDITDSEKPVEEPGTKTTDHSAKSKENTIKNSKSNEKNMNSSALEDEEAARARRTKIQIDRRRDGAAASRELLRKGASEGCDWRQQPLSFAKGEVCGSHYKVLGLDRNRDDVDKSRIKKAFRARSLSVHPDKNPAAEADAAFKLAQAAYDCLSDDLCKEQYDMELNQRQEIILQTRERFKRRVAATVLRTANQAYYYVSLAANYIYQMGVDLWNFAGEFEVDIFGSDRLPLGRSILVTLLLFKGRFLLQLHGMAYIVMRINYEIAKARGVL